MAKLRDSRHHGALGAPPVTDQFAGRARAYCGPAHGRCWTFDADVKLQPVLWLADGTGSAPYRVALDPATRRPARDRLGNVMYLPVR
jgi:hypothetical protein